MTENSENQNSEDPKIIVDEDWKSQVEREKSELREKQTEPEATGADAGTAGDANEEEPQLPPASFLGLLSMLGSQAMSALGVIPDFATGEPNVNRPLAKHCIDMIGVLQEKTRNNLTEDEAAHVRDALHQLRMMFVQTANATPGAGGEGSESVASAENESAGPSIELP